MSEFDSPKKLITNFFELTYSNLDHIYDLDLAGGYRGDYICREVTPLDRSVRHTVITAEHGILGPVRVQLTSGEKRPPYTDDLYSGAPKPWVERITSLNKGQSFFMVAVRPEPIKSLASEFYINPVILVAGVQDEMSHDTGVSISSFWEVLDSLSGRKIAGNLHQLGLSTSGLFFPQDRAIVDSFIDFSQKSADWGTTGTLCRIHDHLRHMKVDRLSQYDLFAGTKSKVTYPSVPAEVVEAAA